MNNKNNSNGKQSLGKDEMIREISVDIKRVIMQIFQVSKTSFQFILYLSNRNNLSI